MQLLFLMLALGAAFLAGCGAARAQDDDRRGVCTAEVAKLRNLDPGSIRFAESSASEAGYVQLPFGTRGARGACIFGPDGNLIDVRFSGGTEHWDGDATGTVSSQQSACAGEFARRFNLPLASVSVSDVQPVADGSQKMVVGAQGTNALCSANSFNAITLFETLEN